MGKKKVAKTRKKTLTSKIKKKRIRFPPVTALILLTDDTFGYVWPIYGFYFKNSFNFLYIYHKWWFLVTLSQSSFVFDYIKVYEKLDLGLELNIINQDNLLLIYQEHHKLLSNFNNIKPFDWDEELVYERLIEETDFERAYALDAFIILDKQIQLYVDEYLIYINLKRNDFRDAELRIFSHLRKQLSDLRKQPPIDNFFDYNYRFSTKPIALFNLYQQYLLPEILGNAATSLNKKFLNNFFLTLILSPLTNFLTYNIAFTLIHSSFLTPSISHAAKLNDNVYYWDLIYNWFVRKSREKGSSEAAYAANRVFLPFVYNKLDTNTRIYEYLIMSLMLLRRKNSCILDGPSRVRKRSRKVKTLSLDIFSARIKEMIKVKYHRVISFDIMEHYSHEIKARVRIFSRLKKIKERKWQTKKQKIVHSLKITLKQDPRELQKRIVNKDYLADYFFNSNKKIEKKVKRLKVIRKKELKLYPTMYHDNWHSMPRHFFHVEYNKHFFYDPKTFFNNQLLMETWFYMSIIYLKDLFFPSLLLSSTENYLYDIYYKDNADEDNEDEKNKESEEEIDRSDFDGVEEEIIEEEEVLEEIVDQEGSEDILSVLEDNTEEICLDYEPNLPDNILENIEEDIQEEETEENIEEDIEDDFEDDIRLHKYSLDLYITIKQYLNKKKKARNLKKIKEFHN